MTPPPPPPTCTKWKTFRKVIQYAAGRTFPLKETIRDRAAAALKGQQPQVTRGKKQGNKSFRFGSVMEDALGERNTHIWPRAMRISPCMIGLTVPVHSGRQFMPVYIREEMVGYRLGEFVETKVYPKHPELKSKISLTRPKKK